MPAYIETLMYVREGGVPWHGLGTSVEDAPNSVDAIKAAELDWLVEVVPLYALSAEGKYYESGNFATRRLTDGNILGVVSQHYRPLQNAEAFRILDKVIGDVGLEVRYETAGSLKGGKQIFLAARLPKEVVIGKGDVQFPYLFLRTGHDGGTALDIIPTNIRPVCWNTTMMIMGERDKYGQQYSGVTLWHLGSWEEKAEQAQANLKLALNRLDTFYEKAAELAEIDSLPFIQRFIDWVIPRVLALPAPSATPILALPAPDQGLWVPAEDLTRLSARRELHVQALHLCIAEEPKTAWGLYNAATGYADHQRPQMWRKPEARMRQILDGENSRIKDRAWKAVTELAGV